MTKTLTLRRHIIFVLTALLLIGTNSYAQVQQLEQPSKRKVLRQSVDNEGSDSLKVDSVNSNALNYKISLDQIDCEIKRRSDSSKYIRATNILELYGNARIEYCDMILEADQINFNTETKIAEAKGLKDSLGHYTSYAKFTQGDQKMEYHQLSFNFETQKGKIRQLVTQQGEGIVRGEEVKKINENEAFIRGTMYTTCNLDHPHFHFTFQKTKIKTNKFVAGKNLNLYIKDIPTPIYFPFAIFPLERGKRAGFTRIAPSYDQQRGFNFSNVGWYQPINDNMDALVRSNFYTSGSWDVNTSFNYIKRYKHRMAFNFNYSKVRGIGISNALGVNLTNSFQLNYQFNQDPKVWPNSGLNANINIGQQNFKQLNVYDPNQRLNNNYNSSISFNKSFKSIPVSLSSNVRYNQNTQSNLVSLSLPSLNLSTTTLYPFRGLDKPGKKNPLSTLTMSYRSSFRNQVSTVDSLFFANPVKEIGNAQYGVQHAIPISANFKLLKYINFSPSVRYNEIWTPNTIRKTWDTDAKKVVKDTVDGFRTARWYSPSIGVNTTVYGMKQFSKGGLRAIRHVMRPSLSLSYSPDFTKVNTSKGRYFEEVRINDNGDTQQYSVFENSLMGGPSSYSGGSVNFSLGNNIEIKVKPKDAEEGDEEDLKKIKLFESLNFSTSYDLAADSLNLRPISMNGNTTLFNNFRVNISGNFNPYQVNDDGRRINQFLVKQGKLADLTNASFRLSGSLNAKANQQAAKQEAQLIENPLYLGEQLFVDNYYGKYVDFTIPWNVSFNYNLGYSKSYGLNQVVNKRTTNAITGNIDFKLTDNWKINGSTGYDFEQGKLNYTNIQINRDLHCWQMSFNWSPVGDFKRYMFTISPKSSLLKDLKVEKKRTVYQNFKAP